MSVLLVIYERPEGYPNQDIINKIRSHENHAQLGRDSYVIETDESPESLYQALDPHLNDEDKLFITQIIGPIAGNLQTNISNWLNVAV